MKNVKIFSRYIGFFSVFLFALLNFFVVILFYENSFLTLFFLFCLTILGFAFWKSFFDVYLFSAVAILFTLPEIYFASLGVWTYNFANFYGIPLWLPVLWGNTGIFIYKFSLELKAVGFFK